MFLPSGVARVLCARVAKGKNIFASLPTKTAESKVKNRCKNAEEAKAERFLFVTFVIFRSTKIRLMLKMYSTKLYQ